MSFKTLICKRTEKAFIQSYLCKKTFIYFDIRNSLVKFVTTFSEHFIYSINNIKGYKLIN